MLFDKLAPGDRLIAKPLGLWRLRQKRRSIAFFLKSSPECSFGCWFGIFRYSCPKQADAIRIRKRTTVPPHQLGFAMSQLLRFDSKGKVVVIGEKADTHAGPICYQLSVPPRGIVSGEQNCR
jgi:hypothetical protein